VESASLLQGPPPIPADPAAGETVHETREPAPGGAPAAAPRRKRGQRSSKVVIIRPDANGADAAAHAAGDTGTAAAHKDAEPWAATPSSHDLVTRLAAINAQIEALQRQALEARRAEAAEAVRWIKRAIAEYGLTAADLGY
jgi:hypothetical protein